MLQVLEHMADPLDALCRARALLEPGGVLFLETWDAGNLVARLSGRSWHQVNPPTVLFLFDRKNLSLLLRRAGLRVERVRRGSKLTSVGLIAKLLAERHPRLLGRLPAIARRLGLESAGIRYGLGDLITVVARPED
jgi:2-polyprenyl-3-methyl-5-hydroxy-6-metoxy-1,4-benzoquinol methylase